MDVYLPPISRKEAKFREEVWKREKIGFPQLYEICMSKENKEKAIKISMEKYKFTIRELNSLSPYLTDVSLSFVPSFTLDIETASINPYDKIININPFYFSILELDECKSLIIHELLHYFYGCIYAKKGLLIDENTVQGNLFNVAQDFIINTTIVKEYNLPIPIVWQKGICLNKFGEGEPRPGLYFDNWKEFTHKYIYNYVINNSTIYLDIYVLDKIMIIDYYRKQLSIKDNIEDIYNNEVKKCINKYGNVQVIGIIIISIKLPNGKEISTFKDFGTGTTGQSGKGKKEEEQRRYKKPKPMPPPPPPVNTSEKDQTVVFLVNEIYKPKVNWKELLSKYMKDSILSQTRGFEDFSYEIPSRRTWCIPEIVKEGTILPGIVGTVKKVKVALVLDISASISIEEYLHFVSEVEAILNTFNDYEILLIECDNVIYTNNRSLVDNRYILYNKKHNDFVFLRTNQKVNKDFFREGCYTSFIPPFVLIDKLKFKPHCLVYFTDLECDSFAKKPEYPVIWLWSTKDRLKPPVEVPYGKIIPYEV